MRSLYQFLSHLVFFLLLTATSLVLSIPLGQHLWQSLHDADSRILQVNFLSPWTALAFALIFLSLLAVRLGGSLSRQKTHAIFRFIKGLSNFLPSILGAFLIATYLRSTASCINGPAGS